MGEGRRDSRGGGGGGGLRRTDGRTRKRATEEEEDGEEVTAARRREREASSSVQIVVRERKKGACKERPNLYHGLYDVGPPFTTGSSDREKEEIGGKATESGGPIKPIEGISLASPLHYYGASAVTRTSSGRGGKNPCSISLYSGADT